MCHFRICFDWNYCKSVHFLPLIRVRQGNVDRQHKTDDELRNVKKEIIKSSANALNAQQFRVHWFRFISLSQCSVLLRFFALLCDSFSVYGYDCFVVVDVIIIVVTGIWFGRARFCLCFGGRSPRNFASWVPI